MTSRFSVVQAPPKDPGHCWITKTSVGPFIDTGVDLSLAKVDRGRIYISFDALREMAQVAGLFDEGEPKTAGLKKKQWYEQGYNDAMKEISDNAIDRFIEHIGNHSAGAASDAAVVAPAGHLSTAGAAIPGPEDSTAGAPEVDQDFGGSEWESASASSVERPASVPADSSDGAEYRL